MFFLKNWKVFPRYIFVKSDMDKIANANSEKTRPRCDKKSKCEDIHGVTHLQYVVYLSGNSSTYIQISPDFPRITQKANKQVNTSVPSVVRLKYLYRNLFSFYKTQKCQKVTQFKIIDNELVLKYWQ